MSRHAPVTGIVCIIIINRLVECTNHNSSTNSVGMYMYDYLLY